MLTREQQWTKLNKLMSEGLTEDQAVTAVLSEDFQPETDDNQLSYHMVIDMTYPLITFPIRYRNGIGRWSVAYIQATTKFEALCIATSRGYFDYV